MARDKAKIDLFNQLADAEIAEFSIKYKHFTAESPAVTKKKIVQIRSLLSSLNSQLSNPSNDLKYYVEVADFMLNGNILFNGKWDNIFDEAPNKIDDLLKICDWACQAIPSRRGRYSGQMTDPLLNALLGIHEKIFTESGGPLQEAGFSRDGFFMKKAIEALERLECTGEEKMEYERVRQRLRNIRERRRRQMRGNGNSG